MRDRVLAAVASYPGIHLRGLVAHLDTSVALARYHIQALEEAEKIRCVQVGGFVRYFPPKVYEGLTRSERRMLNVLRQNRPLEITLTLLEHGAMHHGDLLAFVGGSKATLSYQLGKLVDAGVLGKREGGSFSIQDVDVVRGVLAKYEPVPEMDQAVHGLWDRIFSRHD